MVIRKQEYYTSNKERLQKETQTCYSNIAEQKKDKKENVEKIDLKIMPEVDEHKAKKYEIYYRNARKTA